jgi:hypothetical protein
LSKSRDLVLAQPGYDAGRTDAENTPRGGTGVCAPLNNEAGWRLATRRAVGSVIGADCPLSALSRRETVRIDTSAYFRQADLLRPIGHVRDVPILLQKSVEGRRRG